MRAELTATPDYAYFTLRDAENYAGTGAETALAVARENIAASTSYEIYVICAQDLLPVSITLTDTPPAPDPEWTVVAGLPLECPTGELRLGDATGNAVSAEIDTGPGMYVVDVYYRGRSIAQERRRELLDRTSLANPISIEDTAQFAGTEAYHLHLKPVTD
jgi:hypothetical protein